MKTTYPRAVREAQDDRDHVREMSRLDLVMDQDTFWHTADNVVITVDEMDEHHRAQLLARLERRANHFLSAAERNGRVPAGTFEPAAWMADQPLFRALLAAQGLPLSFDPQPGDWVHVTTAQFDHAGEVTATPFDLGMVIAGRPARPGAQSYAVPRVRVRFTTGHDGWFSAHVLAPAPAPVDPLAHTTPSSTVLAGEFYTELVPADS